jgi:hypothetical protein
VLEGLGQSAGAVLRDFIEPESAFEDDQTVAATWMQTVALRQLRLYVEDPSTRFVTLGVMGQGPAHELLNAEALVAFEQVDPDPVGWVPRSDDAAGA